MGGEVKDECVAVLKAVLEMMPEKGGLAPNDTVEVEGAKVEVPTEEIKNLSGELHNLTKEKRIEAIKRTTWATNTAKGWLKGMFPYLHEGTPEYKEEYESMLTKSAIGLAKKYERCT